MAKVLLNAFYLQSQGKLQNGPGYIRAGIEDGYDLLPQVANRLEAADGSWRPSSARSQIPPAASPRGRRAGGRGGRHRLVIEQLGPDDSTGSSQQAVAALPEPIVRRNPTLSNPFVRGKVYELACGEPLD